MPLPAMAEIQRRIASLEQQFFKLTGGQSVLSGAAASSAQAALSSRGTPTVPAGSATGTAVTSGLMALQQLEDLASDGIITPAEKLQLNQDWVIIVAEGNPSTGVLVLQAAKYGLSATAFNAAYANLAAYVTSSGIFTDMSSNTVLDRTVWDGYVEAYAAARSALAQIGAQLGENFIDSTGNVLSDAQVITSQGTAAAITGQGALATQSTQGLGFSNLQIASSSLSPASLSATISFGPGMVLMDGSGNTVALTSGVSGQTLTASVSGLGGLDTGSLTSSETLYYVYEIYNPTTQAVGCIFSLSRSSPTLPSGFTYWRWIGIVQAYTSAGYWFVSFVQHNYDYYYYAQGAFILTGLNTSNYTTYTTTLVPPSPLVSHGIFTMGLSSVASGSVGLAVSADGTFEWQQDIWTRTGLDHQFTMPFLTSKTFYAKQLAAGSGTPYLILQGFRLNL